MISHECPVYNGNYLQLLEISCLGLTSDIVRLVYVFFLSIRIVIQDQKSSSCQHVKLKTESFHLNLLFKLFLGSRITEQVCWRVRKSRQRGTSFNSLTRSILL